MTTVELLNLAVSIGIPAISGAAGVFVGQAVLKARFDAHVAADAEDFAEVKGDIDSLWKKTGGHGERIAKLEAVQPVKR